MLRSASLAFWIRRLRRAQSLERHLFGSHIGNVDPGSLKSLGMDEQAATRRPLQSPSTIQFQTSNDHAVTTIYLTACIQKITHPVALPFRQNRKESG